MRPPNSTAPKHNYGRRSPLDVKAMHARGFMTTTETAAAYEVSVATVNGWIRAGKLAGIEYRGGHPYIPRWIIPEDPDE